MREKKLKDKEKYKEKDVFKMGKDKKLFKVNDILSLEYKNKTFRQHINDHDKTLKELQNLKDEIEIYKNKIKHHLYVNSNKEYNGNMDWLIQSLNDLLVIKPHSYYDVVTLDNDGYVSDIKPINGIILENLDMPSDVLKGYYKIENNKLVKDETRFNQLYNQL